MNNTMIMQILLQIMLILLNAVFACAEIAIISMNDNKLASMAANGDKRAIRLARLTSQPARFLATIQVAITLSGFLGSAFAADNFSDTLVDWLVSIGVSLPAKTLDTISVILITLLLSYFTLVFGELVPKRIAMKRAESLALAMSALITFISHLFAPIVWFLTVSTNGILRLFGIDPNTEENNVSEEEIRMMVDVGSEKGVIDPEEKEMIQNVFEFDDLTVDEFATHRTDISLLWLEESVEEWAKTIHETRHSLYPICDETVDHVIGILNAKDYFRLEPKTKENILENAVKPAYFVPETVCADVLFRQMKKTRNHFAVVLDEYGGMVGIVTMSDLLEQLVGDLETEDIELNQEQDIERIDSSTWKIRGCATLDKVAKELSIPLPVEDYDTFSGFIFGSYGSIPEDGTTFELDSHTLHIQVLSIADHKIEKTIVCMEPAPTDIEE
ncbi:MAG TPA: HlyC/CorC family transporter [Lachnospiraceae bacterium]|nr:hemolysin family protein [Anaerosporobacter sp.]HAB62342.1 HlyC/CorC family transporter [Lachnospiraceae bacterium]